MIFIFGMGYRTKTDKGIREEMYCPSCRENTRTGIFTERKWITFFFLPVIPYSKTEIRICERCGYSSEIKFEKNI